MRDRWSGAGARQSGAGLDGRVLARVRALLAKAESTEFVEEAEALTAKAQELIARHAVDEALLGTPADVGSPLRRDLETGTPYADARASLLAAVAAANHCRLVHSPASGVVTAFGYPGDLDALELLGASLLAQATAAMVRQGPQRDAWGRSRTRSFRRAFLYGFAQRVGQRLRNATEGHEATADLDRLLPVLAARERQVEAAVAAAFPRLARRGTTVTNPGGWAAGRAAADRADLRRPWAAP